MNIFFLDADPAVAATCMVDKHVVKMILETAQLLSTAHRILDGTEKVEIVNNKKKKTFTLHDERDTIMYQATHINHPSAVWTRTSIENYHWLADHFFALNDEYTHRYSKRHKCYAMGYYLQSPPKKLEAWDWTDIPCCMPEEYKISSDPVINYRNYYKNGKTHLFSWTNRGIPEWLLS